jgi:hypothetical protein
MERANSAGKRDKENEMYGWTEYEVGRLHREQILHEVAMARLEGELRANRGGVARPARDLRWELARYAGLLRKHLGNTA